VDPNSASFGSMINLARSEMSRDPSVWWNLATAFVFMLTLVLAANLFADAVREAFDPRGRAFRVRRAVVRPPVRREPAPAAPAPQAITGDPVHG
jgi:peptide/nickel transport system permease protein